MKDQNESRTGLEPKPEKTSDSVWKDRAATFIETLAQVDDISWANMARRSGNQEALDLARLGPGCRKMKFEAVAAKVRDDQQ